MNLTPSAFYELGPLGECPHDARRLACDLNVSRWRVECSVCGVVGAYGANEAEALAEWGVVEVLTVWAPLRAEVAV